MSLVPEICKVTLPYPVGVVSVANFSESRGEYHPTARRNITLGFIGKDRTDLRRFLRSQFKSVGANVTASNAYKCAPGHESPYCGLPGKPSVYQMVANTNFCLEPTGDTPTRSHFYLAVLTGCIPVIFDFDRGKALRRNIHVAGGQCGYLSRLLCVCVCVLGHALMLLNES